MSDKIFIGKAEKKQTQYGEITKVGLTTADLDKLRDNLSEKGWVNFVIKEGKNGNPYLQIDNWKPSGAPAQQTQQEAAPRRGNFAGQDDLPF
jgi:hypothetical protein